MKLQQGQTWKQGELYFRVVRLERLSVEFKELADPGSRDGTHHEVTKKEFCRMIKGAALVTGGAKAAVEKFEKEGKETEAKKP